MLLITIICDFNRKILIFCYLFEKYNSNQSNDVSLSRVLFLSQNCRLDKNQIRFHLTLINIHEKNSCYIITSNEMISIFLSTK